MSRRAGVAILALLMGGCVGQTLVENTPPPSPRPAPVPEGTPLPVAVVPEAAPPVPEATPRPRPPGGGGGGPPGPGGPGGPQCGTPNVSMDRPPNGANLTSSPVVVAANVGSTVSRVEFWYHVDTAGLGAAYDPAVLIGTANGAPWRTSWSLPRICSSTVRVFAIGFDSCGAAQESGSVTVRVCP